MSEFLIFLAAMGLFTIGVICGWVVAWIAQDIQAEPDDDFYRDDDRH